MFCRFCTTDYVALMSRESNKYQMGKGRGVEQGQKSLLGWIPHFPQIPEGPAWPHIAFSAPILWQESAWEYKFQKDGMELPGASSGTKNNSVMPGAAHYLLTTLVFILCKCLGNI